MGIMKKISIIIFAVICLSSIVQAGMLPFANSILTLKGGYYNPSGVKGSGGLLLGLGVGNAVDNMVSLSFGLDYFGKSFEEKQEADTFSTTGITTTTMVKVLYEHKVTYTPLWAGLNITLPIGSSIKPYIGGDLGWGLANVSYDYKDTIAVEKIIQGPDDGFYSGFGWRARGGARIGLGIRSALLLEASYSGIKVSREEDGGWERELDMSGFGMGAAIELKGL
jgi:hypothetical protein